MNGTIERNQSSLGSNTRACPQRVIPRAFRPEESLFDLHLGQSIHAKRDSSSLKSLLGITPRRGFNDCWRKRSFVRARASAVPRFSHGEEVLTPEAFRANNEPEEFDAVSRLLASRFGMFSVALLKYAAKLK